MSIIIKDLTFTYNPGSKFAVTALGGINLEIFDGEFFALAGHTGCGKTTLVQHFNALTRLQSGGLNVFGHDLAAKKVDLKALRATVGMVFQYPEQQLFAETVEKDISFGPLNLGMPKDEIAKNVKEAIELVGLNYDEMKNKSPFEISGGQKRRVALAGVIAMRPKVLVMDEPTAGLDPRGKGEILSLVNDMRKKMGVTVVMVSHDMNEIYENADRIAVMEKGKIALLGTPDEVFSDEEEILRLNLSVPVMAALKNKLQRERGLKLAARTVESAAEELLPLIKQRGKS